jgi:hypothetical protein
MYAVCLCKKKAAPADGSPATKAHAPACVSRTSVPAGNFVVRADRARITWNAAAGPSVEKGGTNVIAP